VDSMIRDLIWLFKSHCGNLTSLTLPCNYVCGLLIKFTLFFPYVAKIVHYNVGVNFVRACVVSACVSVVCICSVHL